ncbi:MAG: prepilin peptidase [Candidatus Krumholzibacteriia bacterium]
MTDLVAGVFGLVFGSFLNVLIYRLPRDESPWHGRSHCPHCGRTVQWFQNVPVLSFQALRGRCAGCRTRISWRYPLVELMTSALAVLCLRRFGPDGTGVTYFLFLATLLAIAWIDWQHMIIPDELSLGALGLGLVLAATVLPLGVLRALLGMAAGAGFIWAVAVAYKAARGVEGMGFGDVKLAGMIGAFLGPLHVLLTIFLAAVLGSVYGVLLMSRGGGRQSMVAFGTFLAASAALSLFFGESLAAWYVTLLRR